MNILYLLAILALIVGAIALIAVIKLRADQRRTTSTAAHAQVYYERYFDAAIERIKTLEKKVAALALTVQGQQDAKIRENRRKIEIKNTKNVSQSYIKTDLRFTYVFAQKNQEYSTQP